MNTFKFQLISKTAANWSHEGPDAVAEKFVSLHFMAVKDEIFGPHTPSGEMKVMIRESRAWCYEVGKAYEVTM